MTRAWKSNRYGLRSYVGFLHFEALFRSSEHLIDQHLHKHYVRICASTSGQGLYDVHRHYVLFLVLARSARCSLAWGVGVGVVHEPTPRLT